MKRTYTVAEVSAQTGIPRRSVYAAIRSGRLRAMTPNGTVSGLRTTEQWVAEWMERESTRR